MKYFISILLLLISISLHAQTPHWKVYNTGNSGLPGNGIRCLATEISLNGEKIIWIGTAGLAKFDGINWTVYNDTNSGLPPGGPFYIAIDKLKNKWLATLGGGAAKFDNMNWTVYDTSNSGLPINNIFSIDIDTLGDTWFGTTLGLVKYDGLNWIIFNTSNSPILSNVIYFVKIEHSSNKKWIGTFNSGLSVFDDVNWINFTSSNSGLSDNHIRDVDIDKNGMKWISMYGGGLNKFNEMDSVWNEFFNPGFLTSLAIDSSGNKWLGSPGGGLFKFENNDSSYYFFTPANSPMPSYGVNAVAVDSNQNIWIGTDNGLVVYNEKGIVGIEPHNVSQVPTSFKLYQNYPNPFNPTTTINYSIPKDVNVKIKIYDITGREMRTLVNELKTVGNYSVTFNGSSLASGVYFYRIEAGSFIETKRMVLIK